MRITTSMMNNRMLANMNRNLQRMSKINEDIASQKKLHRPSDDPVLMARALKLNTDLAINEQLNKNVNDAYSVIDKTDTALNELTNILTRMRELTVTASNGTLEDKDTQKIREEISQLKDQIVKMGNDTYAGKFIFSGFRTDTPYLKENGNINITTEKEIRGTYTDVAKNPFSITAGTNDEIRLSITGLENEDGSRYTGEELITLDPATYGSGSEDAIAKNIEDSLNHPKNPASPSNVEVLTEDLSNMKVGDEVTIKFSKEIKNSDDEMKQSVMDAFSDAGITLNVDDISVDKLANNQTVVISVQKDGLDISTMTNLDFSAASPAVEYVEGGNASESFDVSVKTDAATRGDGFIPFKNRDFKVTFEDGQMSIKNPLIDDSKKYAVSSDKDLANQFDLSNIGMGTMNISQGIEEHEYRSGVAASIKVNTQGIDVFGPVIDSDGDQIPDRGLMDTIRDLETYMEKGQSENISKMLDELDQHLSNVSQLKGEVGARMKTAEITIDRIEMTKVNFTSLLSKTQDTNLAEAMTDLNMAESVYRASLYAGTKVIQPTLMDFLR